MEIDGRETINEIEVTHLDEPIGDFTFTPKFNQLLHKQSKREQKSAHKKAACTKKSRMMSCVPYFLDQGHERKLIIMLHLVFLLVLFSLFLDFFFMAHCIMVLLLCLIYQASVLSAVECLVYVTLKVHHIFLSIIILLSSLSVAQVNVPGVSFFAIFL